MKKVPAFCHFQQLMWTGERGGPVIDGLGLDDFVGFRLDHRQWTLGRQGVLVTQAHDGRGDHKQARQFVTLGFQTPTQAGGDKTAEKRKPTLPDHVANIIKCVNPRCVTTTEPAVQMFHLVHSDRQEYRCDYCDEEAKF